MEDQQEGMPVAVGRLYIKMSNGRSPQRVDWAKDWPPPRRIAVVTSSSQRFGQAVTVMDAFEWATTTVPHADVVTFYDLESIDEDTLPIDDVARELPEARYVPTIGAKV